MNFDVTHNFLRRVDFEPLIYSRYKGTLFRPSERGPVSSRPLVSGSLVLLPVSEEQRLYAVCY